MKVKAWFPSISVPIYHKVFWSSYVLASKIKGLFALYSVGYFVVMCSIAITLLRNREMLALGYIFCLAFISFLYILF